MYISWIYCLLISCFQPSPSKHFTNSELHNHALISGCDVCTSRLKFYSCIMRATVFPFLSQSKLKMNLCYGHFTVIVWGEVGIQHKEIFSFWLRLCFLGNVWYFKCPGVKLFSSMPTFPHWCHTVTSLLWYAEQETTSSKFPYSGVLSLYLDQKYVKALQEPFSPGSQRNSHVNSIEKAYKVQGLLWVKTHLLTYRVPMETSPWLTGHSCKNWNSSICMYIYLTLINQEIFNLTFMHILVTQTS